MTVQLDGAGRQLGDLLGAGAGPRRSAKASGDDKEVPVFVDDSGRRSRTFRRVGVAMGLACAVYAVVIVITLLSGNSSAPWLPMPSDQKGGSEKVDTKPLLPAESATPSTSPGGTPDPSGSATAPGASGSPGASTSPSKGADKDASDKPDPRTTSPGKPTKGTTPPPGRTTPPVVDHSTPPVDDTTPPVDETTAPVDPPATENPPAGGTGTDTVADGGPAPRPVGQSPGDGPSALSAASPESSVL
ncbi:hypothetical protein G3I40_44960 [Streptomyces sp. SID14478]|uniref:hypothetical protein n=1 Tax=Streptomyces sp. SID14478 TaxID=2706073 RepID=UPI0013E0CF9C|nr:hypothetical protein [Streptomyces sp. SID14478]NEB82312.1 hypothetical protein [Streptomyces sp. SID14478]